MRHFGAYSVSIMYHSGGSSEVEMKILHKIKLLFIEYDLPTLSLTCVV